MDFYDVVSETCSFDQQFAKRLGFKSIFVLNKDVNAVGHGSENKKGLENSIAFGKDKQQLMSLVKNGATAVAITDSYIDKKLMEAIKDEKCILCMPMSIITASTGTERSKNIFRMSKLLEFARKRDIEVGFVSMAKSPQFMNSYVQLIELAKLVGCDEAYARKSISETNKRLGR